MTKDSVSGSDWSEEFHARLNRRNIPGLDGLRALAVMTVIVGHFGDNFVNASLGVLIFFVLSGFLITWLLLKEMDRTGFVSLKNFYKRRVLRIFPAFYAFWILTILIYLVRGHPIHWGESIATFFYYSNYYMGLVHMEGSPFGHTWSLCIEEQFYILWPFLFLLGIKNIRNLTWFLAISILVVWIHRSLLFLVFDVGEAYLYRAFDTRLDQLAIGCLMAVMLRRHTLDRFAELVTKRIWYPAITIIALFAIQKLHSIPLFIYVFGFTIESILAAILLLQLIWWAESGAWQIFEHPIVKYLGQISYPLYLWQQLTLFTARRLTEHYPVALQFVFAMGVTIAIASASFYLVEKPFLKLKSRF